MTDPTDPTDPRGIAIIGMACRFPGAPDIDAFWRNLEAGVDSIRRFEADELRAAGVSQALLSRPDYVRAAPVIEGADLFDAGFFAYSPREARAMDPQQRLLLETAWHAMEDAGQVPGDGTRRTGAFMGSGGVVSSYLLAERGLHGAETGSLEHIANDKDFLATRLSYKLGLTGPSINVQTACSTGLVAVHLACQSILDGECDMALAGAATVRVPQIAGYLHRAGDIRSPDGRCRAYDAAAAGTVFGSGVGVVVLKHLADALADGDPVHAVILGSAVNNDGAQKLSYTASSTEGQARAMAAAFGAAGVGPASIGLVEGHGTGTAVGDPLEVEAFARCFATEASARRGPCPLGSVKTNIGHLEQAAGIASLIKAALALGHRRVPPSLHFERPNPRIDLDRAGFRVPVTAEDWPAETREPRRAAVNSLGLGGTNAFAILEEAPARAPAAGAPGPRMLCLSAASAGALATLAGRWRDRLAGAGRAETAAALATAATGRAVLAHRLAVTGTDAPALCRALVASGGRGDRAGSARRLAFLFPGQGSQYPGMARGLYDAEPAFRAAFERVAARVTAVAGIDLAARVFEAEDPAALADTGVQQPALFAVGVGLAAMLAERGLRPDAVLGHSVGAFAAAVTAGIHTPEDGAELIARRAAAMAALAPGGAMAAVSAGEAEVAALCDGVEGAGIAALNSPENTVISGSAEAVAEVLARAAARAVPTRRLAVSHGFHSALMAPAVAPLDAVADRLEAKAPGLPFVSDMTGDVLGEAPGPGYHGAHLLAPVRFADGLRRLAALGCTDVVEMGPGGALSGFARATLGAGAVECHHLLAPDGSDAEATLASLARLWQRGFAVDAAALHAGQRRGPAPLYPFERKRHWIEPAPADPAPEAAGLAGTALSLPGAERHFQARWSARHQPWLPDHRVYGRITLPVAAAALALVETGGPPGAAELRALTYSRALLFGEDEARLMTLTRAADGAARLASRADSDAAEWTGHIEARIAPAEDAAGPGADLDALAAECPQAVAPAAFYAVLDGIGLNYGPTFRAVRALSLGPGRALAEIALSPDAPDAPGPMHPALLDACLHLFPAVSGLHGDFAASPAEAITYLPISIERFALFRPVSGLVRAHAALRQGERPEDGRYTLDIRIMDAAGDAVAAIEGLTVKRLPREAFLPRERAAVEDWLYTLGWVERPALAEPETAPGGHWLVLAEGAGDVAGLTAALAAAGRSAEVIDAERLIAAATEPERLAPDRPIEGVILATALSAPPLMLQTPEDLAHHSHRQFETTKAAVALVGTGLARNPGRPRLHLLTRGAVAPRPDRLGGEAMQTVLWGHGRVIALEHAPLWGGIVDLDAEGGEDAAVRELLGSDGEDQVAIRDGRRHAPRLVAIAQAPPGPVTPPISAERSHLVTGGLGALGLRVARWLVEGQGARHLWLVARRAPDAAQMREIRALTALGATVRVVSADVSDPDEVAALIARIEAEGPALDGVFHAAGLLDDGIMAEMGWDRYHRVTAAKIEGAWALHRATEGLALSHFVLFSSILSVIGSMGQLNYVAGNAFLDGLVAHRRRLGLAATALNWGPWGAAGLATQSGERGRAIWRARGTEFIPADRGLEAMERVLASGRDHAVVTLTDWPQFLAQFARPPMLYACLGADGGPVPARATIDRDRILDELRAAPPDRRRELTETALGGIVAAALGLDAAPARDLSLREAGLDSLMAISVINEVEGVFGPRLPARALLSGPSLAELAEQVLGAMPDLPAAAATAPTPPRPARSGARGAWLVTRRPRPDARIRLFCFPFAGGGSAVFDRWGDAFDPSIEVVAVEPPGRLGRIDETPVESVEAFVRGLLPELTEKLDRPYAVLGHCLGGLTLYETLRFLEARDRPGPRHIFVSGARPPSVLRAPGDFERELDRRLARHAGYRAGRRGFEQPDPVFAEIVRAFGIADSDRMLEEAELRQIVLPTVRAEFAMAARYVYLPEPPFPAPITVFRGARDQYFRAIDAEIWRKFTSARFELFTRDTGHFAIVEDFDFIRDVVADRLAAACAGAR